MARVLLDRLHDEMEAGEDAPMRPTFARHETFHPRFGWLKKGYDAAAKYPDVFLREDATVVLGVGKNMVRAIRYWCMAFNVLAESPKVDRPRLRDVRPTTFGRQLLSDRGWDPYLEHPGSLWLLHWQLLRPPCLAPAWYAAFNILRAVEFGDAELVTTLAKYRDENEGWENIVDASLKKDALCILRMYASIPNTLRLAEDSLDCPFIELDLLRQVAGRRFQFNIGEKPNLPDEVIVHACLDFVSNREGRSQMMSIRRLAYEPGSPGNAFKLPESALTAALERYGRTSESIGLTESAGVTQMVYRGSPEALATLVLRGLYEELRSGRRA